MYLGRIITKSKKLPVLDFIEITSDTGKITNEIPTLIIGRKIAEEFYGKDKIKVLNKKIEKNIYWTFAKNERRNDFEEELKRFNDRIIQEILAKINYDYFNIFFESIEESKNFINWLYGEEKKYIYVLDSHLYIYNPLNEKTVGFSLMDAEYIGKNSEDIYEKIKSNPNNVILNSDNFLTPSMRSLFSNYAIAVPYLYFLRTE